MLSIFVIARSGSTATQRMERTCGEATRLLCLNSLTSIVLTFMLQCSVKGMRHLLYRRESNYFARNKLYGKEIEEDDPRFKRFGHFSQIVWRATKELGVGHCKNDKFAYVVLRFVLLFIVPLGS